MQIYIVSDACVGYGSPQITVLADKLRCLGPAEVTIIEPDLPSRPPLHVQFPNLDIVRIETSVNVYEAGGRGEYCFKAARYIDAAKPDIIIICCTFSMPTLLWTRHRAKTTVFYSIESIIQYGMPDVHLNRLLRSQIDLILWPEENRMERDTKRCCFEGIPSLVILNSANPVASAETIVAPEERIPRIIHQGTIGVKETFANYFLDQRLLRLPIDVYGPLVDEPSKEFKRYHASAQVEPSSIRTVYHGQVNLRQLSIARRHRAFLVCIWSPAEERGLFAPSNKFFEAIADAVPPITAPHPQHVRLVKAYDCGIVLDDWSIGALEKGLQEALLLFGTPRYSQMVENCRQAVRMELNAELQFGSAARAILAADKRGF